VSRLYDLALIRAKLAILGGWSISIHGCLMCDKKSTKDKHYPCTCLEIGYVLQLNNLFVQLLHVIWLGFALLFKRCKIVIVQNYHEIHSSPTKSMSFLHNYQTCTCYLYHHYYLNVGFIWMYILYISFIHLPYKLCENVNFHQLFQSFEWWRITQRVYICIIHGICPLSKG